MSPGQGQPQEKDTQQLLPVLGAVEKGGGSRPGKLGQPEGVRVGVQPGQPPLYRPSGPEGQENRQDQPAEHPPPGPPADAGQIARLGHSGPGKPGGQGVALTGGDAQPPGGYRPQDNGGHGGAQGAQGLAGRAAEAGHGVDGPGHRGRRRDGQHPGAVAQSGQGRCGGEGERPGDHHPSDGVGGVRPAVHHQHRQGEQDGDGQGRTAGHVAEQVGKSHGREITSTPMAMRLRLLVCPYSPGKGSWLVGAASRGAEAGWMAFPPYLARMASMVCSSRSWRARFCC